MSEKWCKYSSLYRDADTSYLVKDYDEQGQGKWTGNVQNRWQANKEAIGILPAPILTENIVTRLEHGERLVDDTPYGSYVPEKQKFLNDE